MEPVSFRNSHTFAHKLSTGTFCDSRGHVDKKIITLRENLSTKERLDTLLHEAFHACLAISGLSYLLDDENKEEAFVRAFDGLLLPVIKKELKKSMK